MKKLFLFILIFSLTGCGTPYIKYRFNDNERQAQVIDSQRTGRREHASSHPVFGYPEIKEQISRGECGVIDSPIVIWDDGTELRSQKIRICGIANDFYVKKPLLNNSNQVTRQTLPDIKTQLNVTTTQQNSSNIDDAKKKCSDLGFKSGTEGFGKCVLQLSK